MQYIEVKNWDYGLMLSDHFKLGELIQSRIAYQNSLIMQYVYQPYVLENLQFLVTHLLEPARLEFGDKMFITSGYRCTALNNMVDGAKNSTHLNGFAADIAVNGGLDRLARIVGDMEHHELIRYQSFLHVSIKPQWNENRPLIYKQSGQIFK